jgi:hypothetical protein
METIEPLIRCRNIIWHDGLCPMVMDVQLKWMDTQNRVYFRIHYYPNGVKKPNPIIDYV